MMMEYLGYLGRVEFDDEEPDRPFSGQFVARVGPELHRAVSLAAQREGRSLNAWVADRLQEAAGTRRGS